MSPTRIRAVLYSGGQERRNALIHEPLLELAMRRRRARGEGVRMTYMPYTAEGALPFFRRFERRYRSFGATSFDLVAADDPALRPGRPAWRDAFRTIRRSAVVYLAGGNTYYFLAHLRRSGREHHRSTAVGTHAAYLALVHRHAYPPSVTFSRLLAAGLKGRHRALARRWLTLPLL